MAVLVTGTSTRSTQTAMKESQASYQWRKSGIGDWRQTWFAKRRRPQELNFPINMSIAVLGKGQGLICYYTCTAMKPRQVPFSSEFALYISSFTPSPSIYVDDIGTSELPFSSPIRPLFPLIMEIIHGITPVDILGGLFFGNLLTALCFGVLTIQTSSYYRAFPDDGRPVKLTVAFSWTLEAFQLLCMLYLVFILVANHRNCLALDWVPWEFAVFQVNIIVVKTGSRLRG
ncbi:hypothetical protein BS47DRAFT_1361468 [Hydnum rufescens UP504]|uniref:Uncharacterized protein n=1 Tax=Hydnum rufescens UP504 TaxID=1448309 RepID=A0A9P6AZJ3_9AGAM|nr:hypothetical protein BS47DRAFT_1361468 [Hydnum rufescens UP504]